MRRIFLMALIGALVAAMAPVGRTEGGAQEALMLARVQVENRGVADYLMSNFDETHNHRPGVIELLLWPGDLARLETTGLDYEIVEDDLVSHDLEALESAPSLRVPLPGPNLDNYRVLADYNKELKALAKKNPKLVRLIKLNHKTLEGRDVFGVEIARKVKRSDGRPTFYVDGVHHAREWPAGEYPMIYAHYLVEGFGKNKAVTRLLKKGRVVIVPIVNPDGFDYSRSAVLAQQTNVDAAHSTPCGLAGCEGYWRKNRRSFTGVTVPGVQKNPDAYGVDVNRNYSFHWGGGGASPDQTSQTHYGSGPVSEPETKNVRDLLLSENVTGIVSNHTSGRLVLRAWGDTYKNSPDERYQFKLGARMAKAMGGYQNIKGIQLYVTTGTMSDWGYGVFGIPSYTFEHGLAFHPPYTGCARDCVGKQWKGVMKAYMHLGKAALNRSVHGVVKGRVAGGNAHLVITRKYGVPLAKGNPTEKKTYGETIKTSLTTGKSGAFTWDLPPSTPPASKKTVRYTLKIHGRGGAKTLRFALGQGRVKNLGTIRL
jgi:opacity protein-like surface antigen